VFISHAARDHQIVRAKISPLFRDYQIPFWWSGDNIPAGARWRDEIQRQIAECDWFVVALSRNSIISQAVREELTVALETKPDNRIIPILLEECPIDQLHSDLSQIQYVDFSFPTRAELETSYRKLIATLLQAIDRENQKHRQQVYRLRAETRRQCTEIQRLTEAIELATGFDGNWTPDGIDTIEPPFVPLLERRPPILAFANLKGGVGKTTLTANIGAVLWRRDPEARVLLVDLDFQGSLSSQCLGRFDRGPLLRQGRTASRFFAGEPFSLEAFWGSCQPIEDELNGRHGGNLIAATEDLFRHEMRTQMNWLCGRSRDDARYHLRRYLHHPEVHGNHSWILLDCPPRLTTATVNALACCDYLVIPVKLDELSTDAAPHMLQWLRRWGSTLTRNVSGVLVIANETHSRLTEREKDVWDSLKQTCRDHWTGNIAFLETYVPEFREEVRSYRFPAIKREWARVFFANLVDEITSHVLPNQRVPT
jgi:cellulose biosynthesis protein BcsQ